jgi:hypothetical protein
VPPSLAIAPLSTLLVERSGIRARAKLERGGYVGTFAIAREVARAPGAWLFEGRDSEDRSVLIHVARLQSPGSQVELIERTHYEHALTGVSMELVQGPKPPISHGSADEVGGRRVVYWVLPWPGAFGASVKSWVDLAEVGLTLARRLVDRHARGAHDPHLTEHTIVVAKDRSRSEVIGAPILLASKWLCHETIPSRLAPEESVHQIATVSGDLWRLGQALRTMSAAIDELPERLEALLLSLDAIDPKKRPPRASELCVELESILDEASSAPLPSATVNIEALAPDRLAELILESTGDSTRAEAAKPFADSIEDDRTKEIVVLIPPTEILPTEIAAPIPIIVGVRLIEEPPPDPVKLELPELPRTKSQPPDALPPTAFVPPLTWYAIPMVIGLFSGAFAWVLLDLLRN